MLAARGDTKVWAESLTAGQWLWLITGVGLTLRVAAALGPPNDFYPDEIYQVLEQAYRLVHGRGIVPWEFEFGIRNWALPGVVAGVLFALDAIGLGKPVVYESILKALAILLSLTMIRSAFRVAGNLGGERAGLYAAFAIAIFPACVFASVKLTPEILAAYAFMASLAFASTGGRRNIILAGLLSGLCFGLRYHYSIALAIIPNYIYVRDRHISEVIYFVFGASVIVFLFGLIDYISWGQFFVSIYNSIYANLFLGVANLYGESPFWFYIPVLGPIGVAAFVLGASHLQKSWPMLVAATLLFFFHSAIAHKEPRFVFLCQPLLLTAGAIGAAQLRDAESERKILRIFGIVSLALFVFQMLFPKPTDQAVAEMRQATRIAAADAKLRALAIAKADAFTFPGHFGLGRKVPVLLGELRKTDKIEDGFTLEGEESRYTHLIVPAGEAMPPRYVRLFRGESLELWRTDPVRDDVALPVRGIDRINPRQPAEAELPGLKRYPQASPG